MERTCGGVVTDLARAEDLRDDRVPLRVGRAPVRGAILDRRERLLDGRPNTFVGLSVHLAVCAKRRVERCPVVRPARDDRLVDHDGVHVLASLGEGDRLRMGLRHGMILTERKEPARRLVVLVPVRVQEVPQGLEALWSAFHASSCARNEVTTVVGSLAVVGSVRTDSASRTAFGIGRPCWHRTFASSRRPRRRRPRSRTATAMAFPDSGVPVTPIAISALLARLIWSTVRLARRRRGRWSS